MANYTVTPGSVVPSSGAVQSKAISGATITAGQPIYIDSSDSNKAKLADANASAVTRGIAVCSASAGQPIFYVSEDADFTHGITSPTVGDIVIVSATAGALCPSSDMATGMYPSVVMTITSSTKAVLRILNGTAAKP